MNTEATLNCANILSRHEKRTYRLRSRKSSLFNLRMTTNVVLTVSRLNLYQPYSTVSTKEKPKTIVVQKKKEIERTGMKESMKTTLKDEESCTGNFFFFERNKNLIMPKLVNY